MATMTAKHWKEFYTAEREALGPSALAKMIDAAPNVPCPPRGAIIFPHTRLSASGHLIAAAARAVVEGGFERVVALGVMHGAREQDRDRVVAARAGDRAALRELR